MANRGKTRQIKDVKRSKIVVEIGVFYYRCPFVTLGDLECKSNTDLDIGQALLCNLIRVNLHLYPPRRLDHAASFQ